MFGAHGRHVECMDHRPLRDNSTWRCRKRKRDTKHRPPSNDGKRTHIINHQVCFSRCTCGCTILIFCDVDDGYCSGGSKCDPRHQGWDNIIMMQFHGNGCPDQFRDRSSTRTVDICASRIMGCYPGDLWRVRGIVWPATCDNGDGGG